MTIILSLIVARGSNNVIGVDNDLPWRLGTDLKNFKTLTLGKPVIMGRKTWESIGKALPYRPNLVITHDDQFKAESATVWSNLPLAIAAAKAMAHTTGVKEVCVIGGGQIYAASLPFADRLYVTEVDAAPRGHVFFPALDEAKWTEISQLHFPAGPKDDHAFVLRRFDRRTDMAKAS
ncbi:dihydrofolate reductase [Candidatus Phycosocius spiralis]|uniref:Dihydrofolate reductase n=1 Tax=Candidatus Phycosocius spiralis TaxID=2815099 RepID=A0ABQ4PVH6_9PROT|nr:dihydrofolate reductase [Candidatus Phycosocius spiralis]GIU66985.1 dihydrofolate reductase [Candidatus Phycosocius spiralis]